MSWRVQIALVLALSCAPALVHAQDAGVAAEAPSDALSTTAPVAPRMASLAA